MYLRQKIEDDKYSNSADMKKADMKEMDMKKFSRRKHTLLKPAGNLPHPSELPQEYLP